MPGGRFESLRDSMDFRGNFSYRLSSARASIINFVHFEEGHVDAGRFEWAGNSTPTLVNTQDLYGL